MENKIAFKMMEKAVTAMPFYKLTGLEFGDCTETEFTGILEVKKDHKNVAGSVHGGMLYTMIDTFAGAHAAYLMKRVVVTVNSHVEFVRPAMSDRIICKTKVIKIGKNFARVIGEIYDDEDNLLCTSMNLYYPIKPFKK